jgi:cell division septum initiation protein DivIVA
MLLAAACGAGVLGGFTLFYMMYRSQCAHLLTERSVAFNSTLDRLQSMDDKKHIEREKHLLQQNSAMTERHQNLLEKLAECQNAHESTKRLLQQESDQVQRLTVAQQNAAAAVLDDANAANKKAERLQRQLDLAKTMLQEKVDEVEELKMQAEECGAASAAGTTSRTSSTSTSSPDDENNAAYYQLQGAVRRQNAVQLGLLHGQPPYLVHLYLKSAKRPAFAVEVQIPSLHELPHAIHTFLSLIQAGAFLETTLMKHHDISTDQIRLIGGSPGSTVRKQVQAKLTRLYAELGYTSTEPLLFPERSSQPCQTGSLGWIRHGPSLALYMGRKQTSSDNDNDDFSCFGRIVSGLDALETFVSSSSSSSDDRLSIVDARLVAAAGHHEEL